MNIIINKNLINPQNLNNEVVERKGLGHPDTLADGIAESIEIEYCKYCLNEFGFIPHHNFDKLTIGGGQCFQKFGGSKFTEPIKVIFMGRASKEVGGVKIPLKEIQIKATKNYLSRVLPNLDINNNEEIIFESITNSNSTKPNWFSPRDIDDLPEYGEGGVLANDTATMISFWPLTIAEKLSLDIEGFFYVNDEFGLPKPRFKEIGGDIKVMIVRNEEKYYITMAIPQISTYISNQDEYKEYNNTLKKKLTEYILTKYCDLDINVNINGSIGNENGYLVKTGSCIDFGEEGAVGRGNKTHGIISSFRPNTMEAPHGKNSTYFVGKVIGYLADVISKKIYEATKSACQVIIQVNRGENLYNPSQIIVSTEENVNEEIVNEIIKEEFNLKREITLKIINEAYFIPRTNCIEIGIEEDEKK